MTAIFVRTRAFFAVLVSLGAFAVANPTMAQEIAPEHLSLARKYIDLTDRAAIYEVTLVQMGIESMRQIVSQNPELMDPTNTAIESVLESYRGQKGTLLDQFARVYASRFSIAELTEITEFYETPTGQKLATANVELNADLQRVMQVFEANLRTEFFARVRAELRSQGVEL